MSTREEMMQKIKARGMREEILVDTREIEVNHTTIGEVVEMRPQVGEYGPYLQAHIHGEDEKVEWVVNGFGAVLRREFDNIKVGDFVSLTYLGKKEFKDQKKKDKKYDNWRVIIQPMNAPQENAADVASAKQALRDSGYDPDNPYDGESFGEE